MEHIFCMIFPWKCPVFNTLSMNKVSVFSLWYSLYILRNEIIYILEKTFKTTCRLGGCCISNALNLEKFRQKLIIVPVYRNFVPVFITPSAYPYFLQKQPPEVFWKKTGKHLCQSLSFNKVAGLLKGDFGTGTFLWILWNF